MYCHGCNDNYPFTVAGVYCSLLCPPQRLDEAQQELDQREEELRTLRRRCTELEAQLTDTNRQRGEQEEVSLTLLFISLHGWVGFLLRSLLREKHPALSTDVGKTETVQEPCVALHGKLHLKGYWTRTTLLSGCQCILCVS